MTRAAFRQADIERLFRAAKNEGMAIKIDIRTLEVTAIPNQNGPVDAPKGSGAIVPPGNYAPDGEEDWD